MPLVVILVALMIAIPRMLDNRQASPTSPSASATEDPLALPEVGACYDAFVSSVGGFNGNAEDSERVDCGEEHTLETVASAELPDAVRPPDRLSAEARELYRECGEAADEFLGRPWRATYTWLVLSVPSDDAWEEGAHWYRCDLTLNNGFYQTRADRTTGSLRDKAEPITCLSWFETDDNLTDIEPSDCNAEHPGELAGVLPMPEGLDHDDEDAVFETLGGLCESTVLEFLGTNSLPDSLTFWFHWPFEDDLDQWVLCTVSAAERNRAFTASLSGVGSGPIPFA